MKCSWHLMRICWLMSVLLLLVTTMGTSPIVRAYPNQPSVTKDIDANQIWALENVVVLPLLFIPNVGQIQDPMRFQMNSQSATTFLTDREIALSLPSKSSDNVASAVSTFSGSTFAANDDIWDISWIPQNSETSVNAVNTIVAGSGLVGQGASILSYAKEYGVNPTFALAMFKKEAEFAKVNSIANKNKNPGNIIATGNCRGLAAGSSCSGIYGEISTDGRFGVYASIADGIKAYFWLLNAEYKPGRRYNCQDITCVVKTYCPSSDNCDVSLYIKQITQWMDDYKRVILQPTTSSTATVVGQTTPVAENPVITTISLGTVLERIQSLSSLLTIRYNYTSVILPQRELPPILAALYRDKLMIVAVGHIKAGIDVNRLVVKQIGSDTVEITLPAPQLMDCFLDEKASYAISRDTGFFARTLPNLDVETRRYVVGQLRDMALKANIFMEVQTQASTVLRSFTAGMGIKNIIIKTTPANVNAAWPDSCR